jgi:subtilisin family serine protease
MAEDPAPQILVLIKMPPEHFRLGADYGGDYGSTAGQGARRHLAQRVATAHHLKLVDSWPMPLIGLDCFIMAVPSGMTSEGAAAEVSRDGRVAWSEPMNLFRGQGAQIAAGYNDPLYPAQPVSQQWRLSFLHRLATGKGVTVAVIDSGIDTRHPDLVGQVSTNQNFVTSSPPPVEIHGTGVAGIIAARADNHLGIVGVAPQARLMALRACWQPDAALAATVCNSLTLAKAIHYAIDRRAQVINLSLSGPDDPLLGKLLQIGITRGVTVVAAFDPGQHDGGFPASQPGVVAVSDENVAGRRSHVYTAPGRDVPTTQPGGRWYLVNGSSYAAASVSGLVALMRERHSQVSPPLSLVAARSGGGTIDACASLLGAAPCDCSCTKTEVAASARP